jgi:hypothetical protein
LRKLSFVDTLKIHGKYTRAIAGCKHQERLLETSGQGVSRGSWRVCGLLPENCW